jgi:hypothetical protein
MNSQDDRENELQRRERELKAREHALRLRELETEVNQPPLYPTVKHQEPEKPVKPWYGKLVNLGKFLALIVAVVVGIKLATSLATVLIVGTGAWVGYKLFLESDRSKKR